MKAHYPDYKQTGVGHVLDQLSLKEVADLEAFLTYCRATAAEQKVKTRRCELLQIRDVIEKPFSSWQLADIRGFLAVLNHSNRRPWTRKGLLATLQMFLRWKFSDWSRRFANLDDVRKVSRITRPTNRDRYNERTLPTTEEIDAMIRKAPRLRDKCYLAVAHDAGLPPIVQLNLRWRDLEVDAPRPGLTTLEYFRTKNQERFVVPLGKTTTYYLKQWAHEYEYPARRGSDLVFPSPTHRSRPLSQGTLLFNFKRIARRAGVHKTVTPYAIRHKTLSESYSKLPEEVHRKLYGHVRGSTQTRTYSHLSDKKQVVAIALDKIHGVGPGDPVSSTQKAPGAVDVLRTGPGTVPASSQELAAVSRAQRKRSLSYIG